MLLSSLRYMLRSITVHYIEIGCLNWLFTCLLFFFHYLKLLFQIVFIVKSFISRLLLITLGENLIEHGINLSLWCLGQRLGMLGERFRHHSLCLLVFGLEQE